MAPMTSDAPVRFLAITGMSGAGRRTAAHTLEDLGWYVVDNLPPQMLRPLLDLTGLAGGALPKIAAVVDVRGRDLFGELPAIASSLRTGGSFAVRPPDAWTRWSSGRTPYSSMMSRATRRAS